MYSRERFDILLLMCNSFCFNSHRNSDYEIFKRSDSMISDPKLVLYACVSKGTTILAEFTSGDPNLATLALQCLENTPSFHSTFSHTIRKRTYAFLIDNPDPFVYLAIFDETLDKSMGVWYLNSLKAALDGIIARKSIVDSENVISHCLQGDFIPVFRDLLAPRVEVDTANLVVSVSKNSRNENLDSSKGKKIVSAPLLGKPSKGLKKKRRSSDENSDVKDIGIENKVDVSDEGVILTREFTVPLHKNGLYVGDGGRQKARQLWRRHVLIVLFIDLIVCLILFVVWLFICKGFKCIKG